MDSQRTRYVPEDIIFIILLWLPIKKLIQFKSVCKSWRFMISSNEFIQTHLTNSHKRRAFLLNFNPYIRSCSKHIDVHYTPQDSYRVNLPPTIKHIKHIYSCDGLVCLSNNRRDVAYLWNPSTKQCRMLPAPNKNLSRWDVFFGLGFDSFSNDYKLLRIGSRFPPRPIQAEIYSSKANSWKEIQIPTKIAKLYISLVSQFVHVKPGILYLRTDFNILAFELHEEVFRLYPIPPGFISSNLLDFEGYVAMAMKTRDESPHSLYVWNHVCGKLSWTKLFDLDIKIEKIYRYVGTREFLVSFLDKARLYFYDYETRETKTCNLRRSAINYTESLVSVNGWI